MNPRPAPSIWLPLVLLLLAGLFLVVKAETGVLANFAPAMALAFTGSVVLPPRFRLWTPVAVVILADLAISGTSLGAFWGSMLLKWGLLLGAGFWAARLPVRPSVPGILGRCLACSAAFYLAMNTASWLANPAYAKTLAGWIQANTTGEPGYPPAWLFLRNAVLSDQLFSLLLVLLFNTEASWKRLPSLGWSPASPASTQPARA